MKKLKGSEARDRLSDLPNSLIFKIFDFLEMRDVVRTTVLSLRWKNLWTTFPNLDLDNSVSNYDAEKYRNFVNRVLLRWRGTRVQKFKVWYPVSFEASLLVDVALWVRFAIDNGVQELHVPCNFPTCLPQCIYSCSSLQKLCLGACEFKINRNVEWNQLKILIISLGIGVTQHVIDKILCGSPLLEVFSLNLVERNDNFNLSFRSSSLKELSICKKLTYISKSTMLRICTPNLETLTILGRAYSQCLLEDVSSLTQATLGFHRANGTDCIRLLQSIQHVERVTLLDDCIKVIGTMETEGMCRLPKVKFLKLNGSFAKLGNIVRLLEIFPNIEKLVLQDKDHPYNFRAKSYPEFKPDDPSKPSVMELMTVEVTWTEHDFSIFPLIQILLKQASKLEKMVFRVKGNMPPSPPSDSLFLASQKLLRMRRSSPNAELIFCEY